MREAVEAVLAALRDGVQEIVGDELVGIYVSGSAVTDEFDPRASDVDFLVVTERPVDAGQTDRLRDLHRELAARFEYGGRLEGGYAAREQLRPWGIDGPIAAVAPGQPLEAGVPAGHGPSNIVGLREAGRVVAGRPAVEVFPEVDAATLERGVRGYLDELLRAGDGGALRDLAVRGLDLARCVYTLAHGRPSSKREAARWLARQRPELEPVLSAAATVRSGEADARAASVLTSGFGELARTVQQMAASAPPRGSG